MANRVYHSQYEIAQIAASIGKSPRINDQTKVWEIWDIETSAYVSTGIVAESASYAADAQAAAETAAAAQEAAESARDQAVEVVDELGPDTLARIDGYYEDMTVGQTEQVLSTQTHTDKVPYLFRPTAGRADVGSVIGGNRAKVSITGGTVAWNQLCLDGDFPDDTNWRFSGVTHSVANGVLTITLDAADTPPVVMHYGTAPVVSGHVYLGTFEAKGSGRLGMSLSNYSVNDNQVAAPVALTSDWQTIAGVAAYTQSEYTPRIRISASSAGWNVGDSANIRNVMVIDLTLMFGTAIAAQIAALETGAAGAGVAWFRKLFPEPYYAYNAGALVSVSGLQSHDTVGFNAWDEEWEVGKYDRDTGNKTSSPTQIRCKTPVPAIPGATYYFFNASGSGGFRICEYNAGGEFVRYSAPGAAAALRFREDTAAFTFFMSDAYGTVYNNDLCINLSWSGSRNGEYEPYVKHTYPLDTSLILRGIPKLDGNQSLYYDGDEYAPDGTVTRRYGLVDMGTLTWNAIQNENNLFYANLKNKKSGSQNCVSRYPITNAVTWTAMPDKSLTANSANSYIYIKDSAYADAAAFKAAMSGVKLVYELATPTTEAAEPYAAVQIVDDWGTEQHTVTPQTGLPALPVGHATEYQTINMRDKLQHLPFLSDSGDGNYTVQQTGSQMALVPNTAPGRLDALEAKLPAPPSADGTYRLTVTVSGGAAVYSWEV